MTSLCKLITLATLKRTAEEVKQSNRLTPAARTSILQQLWHLYAVTAAGGHDVLYDHLRRSCDRLTDEIANAMSLYTPDCCTLWMLTKYLGGYLAEGNMLRLPCVKDALIEAGVGLAQTSPKVSETDVKRWLTIQQTKRTMALAPETPVV